MALFDLTNSAMVECLDSLNRITCQAQGECSMREMYGNVDAATQTDDEASMHEPNISEANCNFSPLPDFLLAT